MVNQSATIFRRVMHWIGSGLIWPHLLTTLGETVLSFLIGGVLATCLGFVFATLPTLASVLDPYVRMANALPRVVLAPIFLLWFGLGIWSKVALSVTSNTPIARTAIPASAVKYSLRLSNKVTNASRGTQIFYFRGH
jgi:ABC-type nitrate/sulfonate/bicarbonate transport system permease component